MQRRTVALALCTLLGAAAWAADRLIYRDGKAVKTLKGRFVKFDKEREIVAFSYVHVDTQNKPPRAETRQISVEAARVVRVEDGKGKVLFDPRAHRRKKIEPRKAERRAARLAKRFGWRVCPNCHGKGCPSCLDTGVTLGSVKRPAISASEAAELAKFRSVDVKRLAAELVVLNKLGRAPKWFFGDWRRYRMIGRSSYLVRLWRPLVPIALKAKGIDPTLADAWAIDWLVNESPAKHRRLLAIYEWVSKDPKRLRMISPEDMTRFAVLRELLGRLKQRELNK